MRDHGAMTARWLVVIILAIAIIPLLTGFVAYLFALHKAAIYPFQLDYGEGIVWEQMRKIVAGHGYAPIEVFPAIVFHYPPLYHLASAGFAYVTGFDQLESGRLVSGLSTIATGGIIALIVARMTSADGCGRASWVCGIFAGLIIFGIVPVLTWSRLMRVDMISFFFSFAGLYFGLRALTQPRYVHAAALCFVAAVFAKQTAIAAPIAVFATLLFLQPRTAWAGIATGLSVALSALAFMIWQTDGGFLKHIILYNINRLEPDRLLQVVKTTGQHVFYFAAAAVGAAHFLKRRFGAYRSCAGITDVRRQLIASPGDSYYVMVLAYLLFATAMLITIMKSGSNYNYLIEWLFLIAIFAGLALRNAAIVAADKTEPQTPLRLAWLIPLAIGVQAFLLPNTPKTNFMMEPMRREELAKLALMVREARKPVISDEMVMLVSQGKSVLWEPSIFAELASVGRWDERPFIAKIYSHDFAFFVTEGDCGDRLFDSRYNPKVADAIQAAYPVERAFSNFIVHLPATSSAGN